MISTLGRRRILAPYLDDPHVPALFGGGDEHPLPIQFIPDRPEGFTRTMMVQVIEQDEMMWIHEPLEVPIVRLDSGGGMVASVDHEDVEPAADDLRMLRPGDI